MVTGRALRWSLWHVQELLVLQQEMAAQGWDTGQAPAATFQPFCWTIDICTDTIAVGLVDDRYGHHILVLVAKIQVGRTLANEKPHASSKQFVIAFSKKLWRSLCNLSTVTAASHVAGDCCDKMVTKGPGQIFGCIPHIRRSIQGNPRVSWSLDSLCKQA